MLHNLPLEWTLEELAPYLERFAVWLRVAVIVNFQLTVTVLLSALLWSLVPQLTELCERWDTALWQLLGLVVPVACLFALHGVQLAAYKDKLILMLGYCLPNTLAFMGPLMCQPLRALLYPALLTWVLQLCCLATAIMGLGLSRHWNTLRRLLVPCLSLLCATALLMWLVTMPEQVSLLMHLGAVACLSVAVIHDLSLTIFRSSFPESFPTAIRLYVENVALFMSIYSLLTQSRPWRAASGWS
ncbi:membrane protein US19 [Panine betaherpesvirus 2]|uniref:Membrane protein US19 n=1 Tax=Panine betaherpesvirus 2 TaxID=188763 RepID=Q8QRU0_9BETA|nr:membrane protein US19 [Panine betaherpesvirus 2]AAM00798.2 membrane protein US19 [Panine betaherpesvirus 2]QXV67916.1 membrane protein US19 [Panine betaherpesvirus 2]